MMVEGTGIITRIDRYTLSVDGHHIRATEDQERRIRALTPEQRANFLTILGFPKPVNPGGLMRVDEFGEVIAQAWFEKEFPLD